MMKFRFIFIILVELNLTPNSRRRPTPALPIPSLSHQRPKNAETEKKLRALKRELKINGISYETNVHDLVHLSELGNGTSGQVNKMMHKPSGAIIAVKVSSAGQLSTGSRFLQDFNSSKCVELATTKKPKESQWTWMLY